MSLKSLPLLYINLSGEMLYMLNQRFCSLDIKARRSYRVVQDLVAAFYNPKILDQIFTSQELPPDTFMRDILDQLSNISIMALPKDSMHRMFTIVTMVVKYHFFNCPSPTQLLHMTLNRFDGLRFMLLQYEQVAATWLREGGRDLPEKDGVRCLRDAYDRVMKVYGPKSMAEMALIRHTILDYFQDKLDRVSFFCKHNQQLTSGHYPIIVGGRLGIKVKVPGAITYYTAHVPLKTCDSDSLSVDARKTSDTSIPSIELPTEVDPTVHITAVREFALRVKGSYSAHPNPDATTAFEVQEPGLRSTKLGINMYAKSRSDMLPALTPGGTASAPVSRKVTPMPELAKKTSAAQLTLGSTERQELVYPSGSLRPPVPPSHGRRLSTEQTAMLETVGLLRENSISRLTELARKTAQNSVKSTCEHVNEDEPKKSVGVLKKLFKRQWSVGKLKEDKKSTKARNKVGRKSVEDEPNESFRSRPCGNASSPVRVVFEFISDGDEEKEKPPVPIITTDEPTILSPEPEPVTRNKRSSPPGPCLLLLIPPGSGQEADTRSAPASPTIKTDFSAITDRTLRKISEPAPRRVRFEDFVPPPRRYCPRQPPVTLHTILSDDSNLLSSETLVLTAEEEDGMPITFRRDSAMSLSDNSERSSPRPSFFLDEPEAMDPLLGTPPSQISPPKAPCLSKPKAAKKRSKNISPRPACNDSSESDCDSQIKVSVRRCFWDAQNRVYVHPAATTVPAASKTATAPQRPPPPRRTIPPVTVVRQATAPTTPSDPDQPRNGTEGFPAAKDDISFETPTSGSSTITPGSPSRIAFDQSAAPSATPSTCRPQTCTDVEAGYEASAQKTTPQGTTCNRSTDSPEQEQDQKSYSTWLPDLRAASSLVNPGRNIMQQTSAQMKQKASTSGGNWVHILYETPVQAQAAIAKNAKIFGSNLQLGVVPCQDKAVSEALPRVYGLAPIMGILQRSMRELATRQYELQQEVVSPRNSPLSRNRNDALSPARLKLQYPHWRSSTGPLQSPDRLLPDPPSRRGTTPLKPARVEELQRTASRNSPAGIRSLTESFSEADTSKEDAGNKSFISRTFNTIMGW